MILCWWNRKTIRKQKIRKTKYWRIINNIKHTRSLSSG